METKFEKILTSSHKPKMAAYVDAHPECFEEALKLAITDKQPYSWRAAWFLWSYMDKNDKRIRKHTKNIIDVLPDRKENQQRELMKILELMEINEKLEGSLFNHCSSIWMKINNSPSVRVNAFKILVKITAKHPGLYRELVSMTHPKYLDTLSPAAQKAIKKLSAHLS